MKTPEEIAQWVIDNRFPKSEKEKITDSELYNFLVDEINKHADQFKNPPKKTIEERKWKFGKDLDEVIGQPHCYSQITIDFFEYWTEHSEGAKKMRFEKEKVFDIKKRLERWKRNQKQPHGNQQKPTHAEQREQAMRDYLNR